MKMVKTVVIVIIKVVMVIKKDKYFEDDKDGGGIVSVKNALQKPKKVWKTSHYYSPLGEEI